MNDGLSDNQRTMEEIKKIMNSIYPNIQAEMEVPDNFTDKRMPILDLKCWVEDLNEPVNEERIHEDGDALSSPDLDESVLSEEDDDDEGCNNDSLISSCNDDLDDGASDQDQGHVVDTIQRGDQLECEDEVKKESRRGRILYIFYEKEVANKHVIMKKSALAENTKVSSLTQDLIRRMKNTSEYLEQEERNCVVDTFAAKLYLSGYQDDQIKKIVIAGLKGYENLLKRVKEGKTVLHKSAKQGEKARMKRKLLGKSSWFKETRKKDGGKGGASTAQKLPNPAWNGAKKKKTEKLETPATNVLFVPQTPGGTLAAKLRQAEAELQKLCGGKVKIVERGGTTMRQLLHQTNPWSEEFCGREGCLPCDSKEEGKPSKCRKRNVVYRTSCTTCKKKGGKERIYIGESSRSSFERGKEHLDDYEKEKDDSHMNKHFVLDHCHDDVKPKFKMEVLRSHRSALTRQIHEAVLIQLNEDQVLNSKGQYNRCQLPRLTVRMGERVIEDRKDEDQDYFWYLEDMRRGNKRDKTKETEKEDRPSKRRKTSDKVTYRAYQPPTTYSKRKRPRNEEDISDDRLVKTPRKDMNKPELDVPHPGCGNTYNENESNISSIKSAPTSFSFKREKTQISISKYFYRGSTSDAISNINIKTDPNPVNNEVASKTKQTVRSKSDKTQPKPSSQPTKTKVNPKQHKQAQAKIPFKYKPMHIYFKSNSQGTSKEQLANTGTKPKLKPEDSKNQQKPK